jgi:hypothetical protein
VQFPDDRAPARGARRHGGDRAYERPLFGRLLDGLASVPGLRQGDRGRARFDERTPTAAIAGVSAEAASVSSGAGAS